MKKFVLQFIYCRFGKLFFKLIGGIQFSDTNFLKEEGQFIIVANHNSHLDAVTIMSSLPPSIIDKVQPVAAQDYFGKSALQQKMTKFFLNALLISRTKENRQQNPIEQMLEAIDNGKSLLLFPEGSRGEPEVMESFQKGVAILLNERPHLKYVPVFMLGMGKAMPKGDPLFIPHNASLTFGKPSKLTSGNIEFRLNQIRSTIINLNPLA